MNFWSVFNQVAILFLMLLTGYAARRLKVFDDNTTQGLSSILLKVTLPALIISSLQKPFAVELLHRSGVLLVVSFLVYAGSFIVAVVLSRLMHVTPDEIGVFRFAIMFSNVGFMGYPVVQAVLGSDALFLTAIYNLPFNLLVFTVGVAVLSSGVRAKRSWRHYVSPATVSVLIGFVLFAGSVQLPLVLSQALAQLGATTTPLSMILVGALLAKSSIREIFSNARVYTICLFRLLVLPLVVWLVLRAFLETGHMVSIPTIIAAMPVAANTAILAEEYSTAPEFASQAVFVSTLLSLVTIPLLAVLIF